MNQIRRITEEERRQKNTNVSELYNENLLLKTELARVRGLLQRLIVCRSYHATCLACDKTSVIDDGQPPIHEPDCWLVKELSQGAESADIGKLDTADKSGEKTTAKEFLQLQRDKWTDLTGYTFAGKPTIDDQACQFAEAYARYLAMPGSAETGGENLNKKKED